MRWSQTLIATSKEVPADAELPSHQLMLRAGLIRQVTAGVYDFLPLGLKSLAKALAVVREEMNAIGASEVLLPALQPLELWQRSGRDVLYGENLFRLKDRHGRMLVLGPTAEEGITELVGSCVRSYKQLPLSLYQIQTKFRDEYRPRFGLLRVREFLMKDAYSFHASEASLDATYEMHYRAYQKIFARCGLPFVIVEAAAGPIGGSVSHEFVVISDAGEDVILRSDRRNYAANQEKAAIGKRAWTLEAEPTAPLEKVHTPGSPAVQNVAQFMGLSPRQMLKSMLYVATIRPHPNRLPAGEGERQPRYALAVVRGDHEVNEAKLKQAMAALGADATLEMAPENLARRDGWALGFIGPDAFVGRDDSYLVIDPEAAQGTSWAAGANEADHHVKNFNWKRDVNQTPQTNPRVIVADIRNAVDGDPSPLDDGGVLKASRAIELGHIFKLGTRYSQALGAVFQDERGDLKPIVMGCYGIGIARILVAAIESFHDERGIIWPAALAPYDVVITPIKYDGETKKAADDLYDRLRAEGIDVLLDDRDARPGFKFADADLIGFPVRINVGDRGLKEGKFEMKRRKTAELEMIAAEEILTHVRAALL